MKRTIVVSALAMFAAAVSVFGAAPGDADSGVVLVEGNGLKVTVKDLEAAHGVTSSPDGTRAYFTVESDSSAVGSS